jgi:hypothetical protein
VPGEGTCVVSNIVGAAGNERNTAMGILLVLLILALIFGGIGLLVEGLVWMLIIAGALVIAGIVMGMLNRGKT